MLTKRLLLEQQGRLVVKRLRGIAISLRSRRDSRKSERAKDTVMPIS